MTSPNRLLRCLLLLLLTCWCLPGSAMNEPPALMRPADLARYQTLIHEVRCMVCQAQSIADSNSPIADGLRAKIRQLIVEQQSDREIKAYLVKRYGEFILLNPRFSSKTILLWLFPLLCLCVAVIILIRVFKK